MDNSNNELIKELRRYLNREIKHPIESHQLNLYMAMMILNDLPLYTIAHHVNETDTYMYECVEDMNETYLSVYLTPEEARQEQVGYVHTMYASKLFIMVLIDKSLSGIYFDQGDGRGLLLECSDFREIFDLLVEEKQYSLKEQACKI